MATSYTPIPRISGGTYPFTNVTPFTYHDGVTYAHELYRLIEFINLFVKLANETDEQLHDDMVEQINTMIDTVNDALQTQSDSVNQEIFDLTEYVDTAIQQIIDSSVEVQDPVLAGILENPESASRIVSDSLYMSKDTVVVDVRDHGDFLPGVENAATNTQTIKTALQVPGDLFIPAGIWFVNVGEITLPLNKKMFGVRTTQYSGTPNAANSILRANPSTISNNPVIHMGTRSMLSDIGIQGAAGSSPHPGIILGFNTTLERVLVTACQTGIEGSYSGGCVIRDVNVYSNLGTGLRDIVDSIVDGGFFNANWQHGIYLGTGANDNVIKPAKLEWNDGHGIAIYQASSIVLSNAIIDRNGKNGVNLVNASRSVISSTVFRRNGRNAATDNDNAHLFLEGTNMVVVTGITTYTGANDDSSGEITPRFSTYERNNTDLAISSSYLGGCTGDTPRRITSANTREKIAALTGMPEPNRIVDSRTYIVSRALSVTPEDSASLTYDDTALGTYSNNFLTTVELVSRSSTASYSVGIVRFVVRREGGNATVIMGATENVVGSLFGTSVTVTVTASPDGKTVTVTLTNTTTNSYAVRATVK